MTQQQQQQNMGDDNGPRIKIFELQKNNANTNRRRSKRINRKIINRRPLLILQATTFLYAITILHFLQHTGNSNNGLLFVSSFSITSQRFIYIQSNIISCRPTKKITRPSITTGTRSCSSLNVLKDNRTDNENKSSSALPISSETEPADSTSEPKKLVLIEAQQTDDDDDDDERETNTSNNKNPTPIAISNPEPEQQQIQSSPFGSKSGIRLISYDEKQPINTNIGSKNRSPPHPKIYLPLVTAIETYLNTPLAEVLSAGLVLYSSFLVALSTLPQLPPSFSETIVTTEEVITYFFAVEFFLRWYSTRLSSVEYLGKPLTGIDIIVNILPLALKTMPTLAATFPAVSSSSALINLRLLRILRLQRVLEDAEAFTNFLCGIGIPPRDIRPYQLQLARVLLSIFTLISVSTGLIYTAEHVVNPNIPDYFTALYFGLTTLTTVGFGDITPVTFQGRLVVCGSILVGVGVLPAQLASLAEALLDFQSERKDKSVLLIDKDRGCGSCGVKGHRKDAKFCWSCGEEIELRVVASSTTAVNNGGVGGGSTGSSCSISSVKRRKSKKRTSGQGDKDCLFCE